MKYLFLFLFVANVWGAEKPRVGLELEFSRMGPVGRDMRLLSGEQFNEVEAKALGFFQNIFKGHSTRDNENYLYLKDEDNQSWWLETEWVNGGLTGRDGIEIVTHPLRQSKVVRFVEHYDEMLKQLGFEVGQRSSLQLNLEIRSLIEGIEKVESTPQKIGISYTQIRNLNIDRVVNLFLFCEINFAEIYGAFAPKRLGRGLNYYAVPYIVDHDELLVDLAALPSEQRTVENVRKVFIRHDAKERTMKDKENGERTPYKFRAFNLDKLFQLNASTDQPNWVYPAFELRPIDTAKDSVELKANLDLAYKLFEYGSNVKVSADDVERAVNRYAQIRKAFGSKSFTPSNRQNLATRELLMLLEADSLGYFNFIRRLQLSPENYPLFKGLNSSPLEAVWERDTSKQIVPASFGSDSEFEHSPQLEAAFKALTFLEREVTFEQEGNAEVRSLPTLSRDEFFRQIDDLRTVGGEKLRSIHAHIRIPQAYYKIVSKAELSSWLARIGDWIVAYRATEREGKWAFNQRTQGRNRVDEMDGWVDRQGVLHRGTVRLFEINDSLDIEFRGLMHGIFSKQDLLKNSINLLLTGLNNPELIHGYYQHRLVNEQLSGLEAVERALKSASNGMESKVQDFMKMIKESRNIDLLLAPLAGYEYLPFLSDHDVVTFAYAKERWTNELWWLLSSSNTENTDELRSKYWKIVANWYGASNLMQVLASSLLAKKGENVSWTYFNLPRAKLRTEYLSKILDLLEVGQAHLGVKLFLTEWFHRDPDSLVECSKDIPDDLKSILADTLEISNSVDTMKNFRKAIQATKADPKTLSEVMSNLKPILLPASPAPALQVDPLIEIKALVKSQASASNSLVSANVWMQYMVLDAETLEKLATSFNNARDGGNTAITEYLKPFLKNHFLSSYIHNELGNRTSTSLKWILHLLTQEERLYVVEAYVESRTIGWSEICQKKSVYRSFLDFSRALEVRPDSGALNKIAKLLTNHYMRLKRDEQHFFPRERPLIIAELDKIQPNHGLRDYGSYPSYDQRRCNQMIR